MDRNRGATIVAIATVAVLAALTVIAVVIGLSRRSNDGGASGPPSLGGREAFAFDAAYVDADPKVLVVQYGDSGSCPSEAVRHDVVEAPDLVVVTLNRTPMPTDRACTDDYQIKLVRIALTVPLGSREVTDGSRTVPVPVTTNSPPFG
ncbi:MAG: hypothetical protein HHJ11_01980 [Phycicoccus sp.]|nr:hypothetical protein [Phycicoccus sp.]NMM33360.1 hypothetical protein [Phycicoccus sp.]